MIGGNGDVEMSRRLRTLMYKNGIDERQLAGICGISLPSVYAWLECKRSPNLKKVRALKRGLECTWEELLGD